MLHPYLHRSVVNNQLMRKISMSEHLGQKGLVDPKPLNRFYFVNMEGYKFPPFHSFPPSFTRQPVEVTRAKQTELWCDLIRDYCRIQRIFWLDVSKAHESNLFSNPAIDRRLSDEDIRYFLGQLVARGDGEWDPDRKRCLVFWRRPSDWGELIYQWIDSTARNGELLTIHEIRKGRATVGQEFHDLEIDTMMKALQALEAIGKCRIVVGDDNEALVRSSDLLAHLVEVIAKTVYKTDHQLFENLFRA